MHTYLDMNLDIHFIMNPRIYTNRDIDIIMDDAMHRAGVQHVSRHVIANSVRDNMGNTLAMCFARLGMIPSVKWGHDARLYNNNGYNVQAILFNRGIKDIPSWWKPIYKVLDNDGKRICVGCLEA